MTAPRTGQDPRQVSRSTHVGVGAPLAPSCAPEPDAAHLPPETGLLEPVAVIVAHGMGQQLHFETLEEVAEIVRGAEARAHGSAPPVTVRMARLGAQRLPRAEVRVTGAGGRAREVHFYECYWAPLTEGKVTTVEAVWFLVQSGIRGLRLAGLGRAFERYMFDRPIRFSVPVYAFLQFAAALLVIGALLAINALVIAVLTARTVTGGAGRVTDALLADLTADLGLGLVGIFGGAALAMLVPRIFRGAVRARADGKGAGTAAAVVSAVAWLFMIAALASIAATALFMARHAWLHVRGVPERLVDLPIVDGLFSGFETGPWTAAQWTVLLAVWAGGLAVNLLVRRFLLQYVGDVAAYISAHAVSRFAEVRERIQACALDVAEAVYRERTAGGDAFAYPEVVVVGHSLGSVVAYDTLNALLVREALDEAPLLVAERTRTFITFGSPLDKTAFIFRAQRRRATGAREALAAAKQPMIMGYDRRPARWVNIHSPSDWISGSLEYYDDRDQTDRRDQWVQDDRDLEASTPLAAHTEYWRGRRLADRLYEAVTGRGGGA